MKFMHYRLQKHENGSGIKIPDPSPFKEYYFIQDDSIDYPKYLK